MFTSPTDRFKRQATTTSRAAILVIGMNYLGLLPRFGENILKLISVGNKLSPSFILKCSTYTKNDQNGGKMIKTHLAAEWWYAWYIIFFIAAALTLETRDGK
jgi:hypothetical protein